MKPESRIFPFLSLTLAVLLLLSAGLHPVIAESDSEPFVFRNGITWTSSAEEVMAAEGTPGRKPAVEEGPLTMYLGSGYTAAGSAAKSVTGGVSQKRRRSEKCQQQ